MNRVRDHIPLEQLSGEERQADREEEAGEDGDQFPRVAGEQVEAGLAHVVGDDAAFLDGGDDRGEICRP